jgi:hypothetical protein
MLSAYQSSLSDLCHKPSEPLTRTPHCTVQSPNMYASIGLDWLELVPKFSSQVELEHRAEKWVSEVRCYHLLAQYLSSFSTLIKVHLLLLIL